MAKRHRSKNLGEAEIRTITKILDGWKTGPVTWDRVIVAIAAKLGSTYRRQPLQRHKRISEAFTSARERMRKVSGGGEISTASILRERLAGLQSDYRRLESQNKQLLAQFARMEANADSAGISWQELNRPLAPVLRN